MATVHTYTMTVDYDKEQFQALNNLEDSDANTQLNGLINFLRGLQSGQYNASIAVNSDGDNFTINKS